MKIEKIEERISDIEYRARLDGFALEKAKYNYKYADLLNYSPNKVAKLKGMIQYYTNKVEADTRTLDALQECYEMNKNRDESHEPAYLFKCTLPYEKVDPITLYQTSLTVKENVASLFANGVSYKDVIPCLENEDVINIESNYCSQLPLTASLNDDVKVEYIDSEMGTISGTDSPIIARPAHKNTIGIIAASSIPTCYSFGEASYRDFNGNSYTPETPKLGDICETQKSCFEKESKYYKLVDLEETVKCKMQASYDKMSRMLEEHDKKENH
jgi:hypothetical protein